MTDPHEEMLVLTRSGRRWLDGYAAVLQASGMHPVGREVVLRDSADIADLAVLPAGDERWPASRERSGVVVGAVQSGKTASMIGMIARSLDRAVNVVVVLGGRQTALWRQTTERVRAQLLAGTEPFDFSFRPEPLSGARQAPCEFYQVARRLVTRELERGKPIIFVAMKEVHHLEALGAVLRKHVVPGAQAAGVPVNLLVIDDEADDASVAEDRIEMSVKEVEELKQIPLKVLDLWEDRSHPGHTYVDDLYATYVAYTATPQANFLQDDANPLAPRDFVAALRTPGPGGMLRPRELTYRVDELKGWYTGADLFYRVLGDVLCVEITPSNSRGEEPDEEEHPEKELIVRALRSYLVAAAIRTLRSGGLGPATSQKTSFASRKDVGDKVCPITSMLVHPTADTDSHFATKDLLLSFWNGPEGQTGAGILEDMVASAPAWQAELVSYRDSASALSQCLGPEACGDRVVPGWDEVATCIRQEIVPATTVQVVNSRDDADGRPDFAPWCDDAGYWHAAPHHSTIFVSGNVMSRGLTLEGLLITVFTRASSIPLADTQMQMQRWFGYRGAYLDLCRVYLTHQQKSLFLRYAEADEALRTQVLQAMNRATGSLPDFTVLQGTDFRATGKVSPLASRELSPGPRPVVRPMNRPGLDDANQRVLRDFFTSDASVVRDSRGLLAGRRLSLIETAELLDSIVIYSLCRDPVEERRWLQVEALVGLDPRLDPEFSPLYRPPSGSDDAPSGPRSPAGLAAYLRLWAALLDRPAPGLMTSERPPQLWNLQDRSTRYAQAPVFRIGLRFGSGPVVVEGPLADLGDDLGISVHSMRRQVLPNGELNAPWGSRGRADDGTYQGDDLFDAVVLGQEIECLEDGARAAGQPGLLLFQVIDREDSTTPTISVAMSIPVGGPDYVQAVNTRRGRRS